MDKPPNRGDLEPEWNAYMAMSEEWKKKHWGKTALFKGGELQGIYDTGPDAYAVAVEKFGLERFLVHQIGSETEPIVFSRLAIVAP